MNYARIKTVEFFETIKTEEDARALLWKSKFDGKEFECPRCGGSQYYQHKTPAELRTCAACLRQERLRVGTIFQDSKLPLLTWLRAIYIVMEGKRGVSALELKRRLGMKSYGTTWLMLMKIRRSLQLRDERYKLKNFMELDGAKFGRRGTNNQRGVLIAVETKDWIDDQGRPKSRAGFAKVMVAPEDKSSAQEFVNRYVKPGAMINVDASLSFRTLKKVDVDWRQMNSDHEELNEWLPWVHRFISNAKAWVVGTHHGVAAKYIDKYLAEYTYRFNRRHDPDSLFFRAMRACSLATPAPLHVLTG
jgi:hypothetical protein